MSPEAVLKRFRFVGMIEGISFLVLLLIAMPLKYAAGIPQAVSLIGMAHGVLFVIYLAALAQAWSELKWPFSRALLGGLAGVLPFGPWIFDTKVLRGSSEPHPPVRVEP